MTGNRALKKIMCAALAGVSVFASAAMFSACTTSHPKVEMKISFNDTTYTLEYKLYRKIAPSTVDHFLELTEKGYYDGLCVHNYAQGKQLLTGGYKYDSNKADEGGLVEKSYFDTVKDWNLTQTVWDDENRKDPVYTVYGEFSDNGFQVENSALKQSYGSLTMYYTPKATCSENVYVKRADGKGYDPKPYKYNSATSLFYISLAAASSNNSNYCTFATLESDSEAELKELEDAVKKYIEEEYEENTSDFAPSVKVVVDEDDRYMGTAKESQEYSVPKSPIVIKSVKVKSY